MNEYNNLLAADENNTCRGCLKTGQDVQKVNESISTNYKGLVSIDLDLSLQAGCIFLCIYCKYRVNKTVKFIQQCRQVNTYIEGLCFNKAIHNHSYPSFQLSLHSQEAISISDQQTEDLVKAETGSVTNYSDGISDDDLPLSVLKEENTTNDGDIDVKIEIENQDNNIIENAPHKSKTKRNWKQLKRQNSEPIKSGFTSRMVQETAEYQVIKLSKEEVLEEMRQKMTSEQYKRSPFKCTSCVKGYNFEDVLTNHMQKHSPKSGPHVCDICHQYCPSAISLRGHIKSHTTRYKCKECGAVRLGRQHLLEHYKNTHTDECVTYKCDKCQYITERRTAMQRHAKTHSQNQKHTCDKCGKNFKNIESLRAHVLRHDSNSKFSCPQCPRSFIYPSLLRSHVLSHDRSQDFYCVECDVRFKTRENLRTHYNRSKAHRDPSTLILTCEFCNKMFHTQATLTSHLSSTHNFKKEYPCSACSREYSSADSLRTHERRVHRKELPEKRHACHLCNLRFAQRAVLVKHLRVHTGERPYQCVECGVSFAQHATRYTHTRLVHRKLPRPRAGKKSLDQQQLPYTTLQSNNPL